MNKTFKKFVPTTENYERVANEALLRAKQIPTGQWWKDMLDILRRAPLSQEQLQEALLIIVQRFPAKTCMRCRKLKADGVEGSTREFKGFGRQFLCSSCQGILEEKGQLE